MADRQARSGLMPPWANGKNAKEFRAAMGGKPIVGIFSVGLDGGLPLEGFGPEPEEIRLWVADGIANGMRPWFTKFGGTINDPRWLKPVEEIYGWCHGAETLPSQRASAGAGRRSCTPSRRRWFSGGDAVRRTE